jgi:hypothetical protein
MRYSGEQQRELDRRTGAELDRRAAGVRPRLTPREMYTPEKVARMEVEWKAMEETREKNGGTLFPPDKYTPEHFAELREQWLQRRTEARKAKATITLAELYGILVEVTGEIDKEKRP